MKSGSAYVGCKLGVVGVAVLTLAVGVAGCGSEGDESSRNLSMVKAPKVERTASHGANHAPVVDEVTLRPERPAVGSRVQAAARVTDPDGDATSVVFRWQTTQGRVLGEGRTFDTTGLEPGSRLEVIATPSDGSEEGEPTTRTLRLAQPASEISLVAIDASEGTKPGAILRAVVEVVDDESGRARAALEWKVNGAVVGTEEELETQPFSPGDIVILRASLSGSRARRNPVSSQPLVLTRGGAPEIVSKPLAGIEGGLFRYQLRARSPEPDAELTYELLEGPDGMRVDARTGLVEWRPGSEQRGRFEIEVSATDQWGSGIAQSFAIVAESPSAPAAPAR